MGRILLVFAGLVLASAGVLLLLWLLWLLWKRDEQEEEIQAIEIEVDELAPIPELVPAESRTEDIEVALVAEVEAEDVEAEAPAPDDLKKIEGIGPKISSVLQAAGISTFAQLADSSVDQLQQILETEDPRLLRLANPKTWPDQAALAAAGEWDAFKALQKELKAGR